MQNNFSFIWSFKKFNYQNYILMHCNWYIYIYIYIYIYQNMHSVTQGNKFCFFFHHTTCGSTCDTLASSAANQGVLSPWLAADKARVSHVLPHVVWRKKYIYQNMHSVTQGNKFWFLYIYIYLFVCAWRCVRVCIDFNQLNPVDGTHWPWCQRHGSGRVCPVFWTYLEP